MNLFYWYIIAFIPVGILLGLAAAVVGFTAWAIVVPLVLTIFHFSTYESIYLAFTIDFINGAFLAFLYRNHLALKITAVHAFLSSGVAFGVSFVGRKLLMTSLGQKFLKGGVGYLDFALALLFAFKTWQSWKRNKASAVGTHSSSSSSHTGDYAPLEGGVAGVAPLKAPVHSDASSLDESLLINDGGDRVSGSYDASTVSWTRHIIMACISILFGGLSGVLGVGSGMNFAVAFIYVLKQDTRTATANACVCMSSTMLSIGIAYSWEVDWNFLYPYLLVGVTMTVIGSALAAKFTMAFTELKLNAVICLTLLSVGVIVTVEGVILKGES